MVEDILLQVMRTISPTVYNKIISSISTKSMRHEDLMLLSLCVIAENNLQICKSIDNLVDVINKLSDKLDGIEKVLLLTSDRLNLLIKSSLE